eukprot:9149080-Prorocentrum_lima.AAC.1
MTSSLVGSEMCIRDRDEEYAFAACACETFYEVGRNGKVGVIRRPLTSVSYTHLTLPTICSV